MIKDTESGGSPIPLSSQEQVASDIPSPQLPERTIRFPDEARVASPIVGRD